MSKKIFLLLILFLSLSVFTGLYFGAAELSPDIFRLRLCRIITGLIAGAGLAVSGVIFQGILRNPLAEPYVLGVSSGAGVGAVLGLFFNLSLQTIPVLAFFGAGITMLIVYNLAKVNGRVSTQNLLLSGVIVGAVFSSILLFLVSISPNEAIHGITWWLLGSLQVFDIPLLATVSILVLCGIGIALFLTRELNAISLGEEEALHLGVNVDTVKRLLFVVASLITGSIVCVCGIIGFIGLIIPHAVRSIIGSDHRQVLPASAIAAGAFLILADTLSRVIMPPVEIPIGVITAFIGGPVFILLLRKKIKSPF
ncbi:MAG: iron ABC transporter permease [Candidatus Omnitrophica bacterium]|nr:iron ABC transporter permease [Candidatus Omnitrophota bacterium]MDD5552738.1 iron ABC transporter permease [Candidatus Omnitrophota bacterium]